MGTGERVLIYGMQSSGATLATLLLSQRPTTLAIPDVFCRHLVFPADTFAGTQRVVAKATISIDHGLDEHIAAFRPHKTVLVLRHPCQILTSLSSKHYANEGGSPLEKLAKLEEHFVNRAQFDAVVRYEDLVLHSGVALGELRRVDPTISVDAWSLSRTMADVVADSRKIPALDAAYGSQWGPGNLGHSRIARTRLFRPIDATTLSTVAAACPATLRWYEDYYRERCPRWQWVAAMSVPGRLARSLRRRQRHPGDITPNRLRGRWSSRTQQR